MKNKRRIVITGLGVVSPNGIGRKAFWEAVLQGKSAVDRITRLDASDYPSQIAAEIKNFEPTKYISEKTLRRMDTSSVYAIAAAKLAVEDAKLDLSQMEAEKVGISLGTSNGGTGFAEREHTSFLTKGPRRVSPFLAIAMVPNASLGFISVEFGIKGYSLVSSTGCTSGSDAIGFALNAIRHGHSDIMFAGGTEAPLEPLTFYSFCPIRAMSTRNHEPELASRPFDRIRDGFVIGEGAGILILEELEHAKSRGASIYAELVGYGTTCDAYHMTAPAPDAEQAARAAILALRDANLKPEAVDYINAHGSSTPLNDKIETIAIKNVFGGHAYKLAVSSTKSMIGHPIGAAGALELIVSALAVQNDILPPTINYEYPDPECDLDYVPNVARKATINVAVSNSYSFSGKNSVLVIKTYG